MKIYAIKCIKDYNMEDSNEIAFKGGRYYTFVSLSSKDRVFTFDEEGCEHFMNLSEIENSNNFEIVKSTTYKEINDIDWFLQNG